MSDPSNTPNDELSQSNTHVECHWINCLAKLPTPEELKIHLDTHLNPENKCLWIDCTRFAEVQPNKYALLAHLRKHSGDRPFKCQKCSKSYTRADALSKHNRIHKQYEKTLDELVTKATYLEKCLEISKKKIEIAYFEKKTAIKRLKVISMKFIETFKTKVEKDGTFTCLNDLTLKKLLEKNENK